MISVPCTAWTSAIGLDNQSIPRWSVSVRKRQERLAASAPADASINVTVNMASPTDMALLFDSINAIKKQGRGAHEKSVGVPLTQSDAPRRAIVPDGGRRLMFVFLALALHPRSQLDVRAQHESAGFRRQKLTALIGRNPVFLIEKIVAHRRESHRRMVYRRLILCA